MTAALSADEAFAADITQDGYVFTKLRNFSLPVVADDMVLEYGSIPGINSKFDEQLIQNVSVGESGALGCASMHAEDDLDEIIAIIDPNDPDDCPEIVDLWFELVDAGYTEDEAFDLVEMLDVWLGAPNELQDDWSPLPGQPGDFSDGSSWYGGVPIKTFAYPINRRIVNPD